MGDEEFIGFSMTKWANEASSLYLSAEAAEEKRRRYEEDKIFYYKPCCRAHDNKCTVLPCPDSIHTKFHQSSARIRVVIGGNRCIDGNTLIYDPVLEKKIKVKDIESDFHVYAWDGNKLVVAKAEKPFVKGVDDLYRVKLSNGEELICTTNHRVLTQMGYVELCDLAPGDKLISPRLSSAFRRESSSEFGRPVRVSGGQNSSRKAGGSRSGCSAYFRPNDAQLLLEEDADPNVSPSQVGAQAHIGRTASPSFERLDDGGYKLNNIHFCQLSARPSNRDALLRRAAPFFGILSHVFCRLSQSVSRFFQTENQSNFASSLPKSNSVFSPPASQSALAYSPSLGTTVVDSITYFRSGSYYDFTVPIFHNYYAAGIINHNSGKSTLGIAEMLMSSCMSSHPYTKKKNANPGRWRIFSSDFGIIEKLFIPMVREWIPRKALLGEGKSKEECWQNSYDNKYHVLRLKSGTIDFMSYDQDASKSESVELDGVLADEEMPEHIYSATLARLISRNGRFWMTVTPLYNLTWAMKFLDSMDPQVETWRFEIYDNPHLSKQAIKEFEDSVPEHEKDARIYGRFMELRGLVYKELKSDVHLIAPCQPKSNEPVIFAMDPHPRKATVMTWAYVTNKGDVVFFDELEMKGTARDIVSAIKQKEYLHGSKTMQRIIDPAAKAQGNNLAFETDTLKEFEKEGMSFSLADNSEAGYNVTHEYLTYDTSRPMSSLNRPRCFFTKDVPKTWYGMTHLMWDEWTFKKHSRDEKERVKDWKKDAPDCVRYTLAARPTWRSLMLNRPVPIGNMNNMLNHDENKQLVREMALGIRAA